MKNNHFPTPGKLSSQQQGQVTLLPQGSADFQTPCHPVLLKPTTAPHGPPRLTGPFGLAKCQGRQQWVHVQRRAQHPLEAVGWAAGHLQTSSQLRLVGARQALQVDEEVGAVTAKVGAVEVVQGPGGGAAITSASPQARPRSRPHHTAHRPHHDLAEAIEVELSDEAGEVLGLEKVGSSCRAIVSWRRGAAQPRAQQLALEELLVDEQPLATGVPADGAVVWAVYQLPQFGREVVGVDGGGQPRLLHAGGE